MRSKTIFFLLLAALVAPAAAGQEKAPQWHMERGEALYRAEKYAEAAQEFRMASEGADDGCVYRERVDYMLAMSAYRAGKDTAMALLEDYVALYPDSPVNSEALFALGNLYFDRGDYGKALGYYLSVDPSAVESADEYDFKVGYSYFSLGQYSAIYPHMEKIGFKSAYYLHAQYCLGYADYRTGDYASAKRHFMKAAETEAYSNIISFYLIQIEFNEGNYHYVTENAGRVLRMATGERAVETMRITAESWFHTSGWQNAVQYMDEYAAKGGHMGRQENYMLGYSHYMMKDWAQAEKHLSRAAGPDDALSQNASYHLGDVYIRLGDKQRALQSFSIASSAGYDDGISEDALFNYGKLQYELGGGYFNEAINVLNRYMEKYPSSRRIPQVKEYLAAAYYNSRNFEAAYQALSQMPDPDNNARAAMQKITYFRALEFYNAGDYAQAAGMMSRSLQNRYNAKYTALAGYWEGEILYKQGNYDDAVDKFETYIRLSPKSEPENLMARYNIGYAYFNRQDWVNSREWFDNFLIEYKTQDDYRADAYNRRGDLEFYTRSFWRAIEYYDLAAAVGTDQRHYSAFRRAQMLGMVDRQDRKIESLREIVKKGEGPYVEEAAYEIGLTYMDMKRYTEASIALEDFVKTYPQSGMRLAAMSDLGLVYRNLNNNTRALEYYKAVVAEEKHSDLGRGAMNAIRSIYVEENDVNAYFAYARSVGIETDLGAVQRDSLAFAAAQRVYLSGDKARAAAALGSYLKDYPQGSYVGDALYFSGENALTRGEKREAYGYFTRLTQMYNNDYTVRGLERLAPLAMELKDYPASAAAYEKLAQGGGTGIGRDEALSGWLRATVAAGNAERSVEVARGVAERAGDKKVQREAKYAVAKYGASAEESLVLYRELSADVSDAEGAEAAYCVIAAERAAGNDGAAEKLVYDFAARNTPHMYWLGKSFLLLGDIYAAANDSFQARATYQSIVDGYSEASDGIINEALEKIKNLK